MNDNNIYLTVRDEQGELRPMAGIWRDNETGRQSAGAYQKKNPEIMIVRVEIIETNN